MMAATADLVTVFERLRARYPQTVAAFAAMPGGEQSLAAVERLDARFAAVVRGVAATEVVIPCDALPVATHGTYDVVYLGGVLGLINATALAVGAARDGQPVRIALLDEGKAGNAHREWNISLAELAEIVRAGVATWDDLAGIVANRYRAGIVRFHAETIDVPAAPMTTEDVLDVAVRADALLAHCRRRFTECGGVIYEGRRFRRCYQRRQGRAGSVIEVEGPDGQERYGARLVVDAMGTISPVAWAINQGGALQGVCPTAGTTARGFRRGSDPRAVDPSTGEVLITIADVQEGRQLIWEGFPAAEDEYTVYLFYYDRIDPAQPQSLLDPLRAVLRAAADLQGTGRGVRPPQARLRLHPRPLPRCAARHGRGARHRLDRGRGGAAIAPHLLRLRLAHAQPAADHRDAPLLPRARSAGNEASAPRGRASGEHGAALGPFPHDGASRRGRPVRRQPDHECLPRHPQ